MYSLCICFYNPCNFGDTFFASPFVRHICNSNPSRRFYYILSKGEYIFSGHQIPNLYNIQTTTALRGNNKLIDSVFNKIQHPHRQSRFFDIQLNQERYIFMNIWCAAIASTDVNFRELKAGYTSSLDSINAHYRETFVNKEIPNNKIMPIVEMPLSIYNDNGFSAWIRKWHIANPRSGGRRLVFIFNFTPLSAINEPYHMNHYIVGLARMFPNTHTFMVPSHAREFDAYPNIICCDRLFGYSESEKSFRNLFILETIVRACDTIISQYCGASWIWFNENLAHYFRNNDCDYSADGGERKAIYITHPVSHAPVSDYALKMNRWFRVFMGDDGDGDGDGDSDGGGRVEYIKFVSLVDLPSVM